MAKEIERKPSRPDRQLTGMAGEFLAIGKLFKLGLQASFTLGNAKSVDVFVHNPHTRANFAIQVKTLRYRNVFIINPDDLTPDYIYLFVCLNEFKEKENYFLVKGRTLIERREHYFGKKTYTIPGINFSVLKEFEDNWEMFFDGMTEEEKELYGCFGVKSKEAKVIEKYRKVHLTNIST